MTFKDQMTSDLSVFFNTDEFAETGTYTPVSGDAVENVVALINRLGESEKDESMRYDAEISFRQSQVADRPAQGATFASTDGAGQAETWEIQTATDQSGVWICTANRARRPNFGR